MKPQKNFKLPTNIIAMHRFQKQNGLTNIYEIWTQRDAYYKRVYPKPVQATTFKFSSRKVDTDSKTVPVYRMYRKRVRQSTSRFTCDPVQVQSRSCE